MRELRLELGDRDVGALYQSAPNAKASLVFAHGAGAGMHHSTLNSIATNLVERNISVFRFNFPYMEDGKNRVDSVPVAVHAISRAVQEARKLTQAPCFIGGHSFGGRMASHAVVDEQLDVAGLIFCSFPLHTAKRVNTDRAAHMDQIKAPMLFLSGTRDGMATPALMEEVTNRLGATLHWLDTADHGYKVLKRTRTRSDDVFTEMADYIDTFVEYVKGRN